MMHAAEGTQQGAGGARLMARTNDYGGGGPHVPGQSHGDEVGEEQALLHALHAAVAHNGLAHHAHERGARRPLERRAQAPGQGLRRRSRMLLLLLLELLLKLMLRLSSKAPAPERERGR